MKDKGAENLNLLVVQLKHDLHAIKNGTMGKIRGYCSECDAPIIDSDPIAFTDTQFFHSECFVCTRCKSSLSAQPHISYMGFHYCETCYKQLQTEKCNACQQVIDGTILRFLDKCYHPKCLACHHCKSLLTQGQGVMNKVGHIFCISCYELIHLNSCSKCNQPIKASDSKSEFIKFDDKHYHAECFKCCICHIELKTSRVYSEGSNLFCGQHYGSSSTKTLTK